MTAPTREQVIAWAREAGFDPGTPAVVDWLSRFAAVVSASVTRKQHIDALVGDRITADKADHICDRDGYAVTGVVLTLPDGRACIVNRSAVRWLHGETDLWNLLHTDSGLNQRLISEAVAAEREACAKVCDALRDCEENTDGYRAGAGWCAEVIRSRGQS